MTSVNAEEKKLEANSPKGRSHFSELLKVEWKLNLREPLALGMGIAFPIVLLILFGEIGNAVGGTVGNSGLSIIDVYIPTIMVIGFISIAGMSLPRYLVRDREIGWLRRVSTTPVHPSRLLAAQMIIDLVLALVATLIVLFGGELFFHAPLDVSIPYFSLSIILSIAELFSLGLVVAAIAPSLTSSQAISGGLFFVLLFLSGLWIPPEEVGGILQTIMWYSPGGAASRALLYSIFNTTPPYTTLVTMVGYTIIFALIAIRYFRWE
jgi:ABC-2 type transport system permease protein